MLDKQEKDKQKSWPAEVLVLTDGLMRYNCRPAGLRSYRARETVQGLTRGAAWGDPGDIKVRQSSPPTSLRPHPRLPWNSITLA